MAWETNTFLLPVFSFRRVKISDGEDQTEVFKKVAWETNTFLFACLFLQKSKSTLMEKIRQKYSEKWPERQTLFFLPTFSFSKEKVGEQSGRGKKRLL